MQVRELLIDSPCHVIVILFQDIFTPIPAMGAEFGWADPHRCIPRVPETEPKRRKPRTAAEIHQGLVD